MLLRTRLINSGGALSPGWPAEEYLTIKDCRKRDDGVGALVHAAFLAVGIVVVIGAYIGAAYELSDHTLAGIVCLMAYLVYGLVHHVLRISLDGP